MTGGVATLFWFALLPMVLLLLVLVVVFFIYERSRRESFEKLQHEIETLKQTVSALCSSAVGVDKRVNRLERHGRDLEERQENIEHSSQQGGEPPYSDAIRMVHAGAGPEQLVEELGISRDAADLIIMIHGMKREDA
jgi:ABC-type transport system involved in cytochrome bd biosynthesis fused ATPase/permease subunit